MRLISHRGNLKGKQPHLENTLPYIHNALEAGYDVEIDAWYRDKRLFLGHDQPIIVIENLSLLHSPYLWVHAKNIETLNYLLTISCHCFFHNHDDCTLTSQGFIWVYPGKPLFNKCIAVLPEITNYSQENLKNCCGICSDYIENYL